jgi:tol-pal system protein YbgF
MQADNEYRFGQLEQGKGGGKREAAAAPSAPQTAPAPAPADSAAAGAQPLPAGDGQQPLGAPPKDLGTLTLPATEAPAGGQQPLDLSALARGDAGTPDAGTSGGGGVAPMAQPQQVGPPSGDPAADYKVAYELFVSGQYASAEKAFRQFLDAYPGDEHAADATYWLGQSLFSRGMYREAALEFVNGHKHYPKSARAADTMLLLGKSLAGIPEREAACQTFAAALKQYPNMSNALRQRVITEQANAGC